LTASVVVPVEPKNTVSPEYVPEIVSVPTGAAEELHEPVPFVNVAAQSGVDPAENVTEPLGVPPEVDVTVAEYVTEAPTVTDVGFAPIEVCVGALFTTRLVVPVEPKNSVSPEYVPEIVSVPIGAAEELQEPVPALDNVAVQRGVNPVENVTDPLGMGNPVTVDVTLAEYITEAPTVTEAGLAPIEVCVGALLTTRLVVPVEPKNMVSPEYVPVMVSVPIGAVEELQEPVPALDNVAVQSDVNPVENVTDPLGMGSPVTVDVTVAEYVTDVPTVAEVGLAPIEVSVGALLTTRLVVPVEPAKTVSPE
jgi:hypothetical protein